MPLKRTLAGIVLLLFTAAPLFAAPPIASGQGRDFGFDEREIYQFKDGLKRLTVRDINDDGRDDLLFVNNAMSRLELLVRRETEKERPVPNAHERRSQG